MNAYKHSQLSARRCGGKPEDYLPIHDFLNSTKELCSDNRHRILHTNWGIRRVIIPIFGETIVNSDGQQIIVKDICEKDHILPDYKNRFIPTLSDFTKSIIPQLTDEKRIKAFAKLYEDDKELVDLLLSPLSIAGSITSLLVTHNSWFINEIVPKVLKRKPILENFDISPSDFFERMSFELWMDNGNSIPDSAKLTAGKVVG